MGADEGGRVVLGEGSVLDRLQEALAELNRSGGFTASVLTDLHGLTIASAANPGERPEEQAAAVALIQKAIAQAHEQLGMAGADEITLSDAGGKRLICRLFGSDDHRLILAVMVPEKHLPYRRLTNAAVRSLGRVLQDVWE